MSNSNGNASRLDSWKEIAAYLRRDVRTAIRWEKEKGLPVHRVRGGQRQAVFAYAEELDEWLIKGSAEPDPRGLKSADLEATEGGWIEDSDLRSDPIHAPETEPVSHTLINPPSNTTRDPSRETNNTQIDSQVTKLKLLVLIGLAVVLVIGLSFFTLRFQSVKSSLPVRLDFTLDAVVALDAQNQILWTHTFPGQLELSALGHGRPLTETSYIADFRSDGQREVLVTAPIHPGANLRDPAQTEVYLFSSQGKLLWSYEPQEEFLFGKYQIMGPWSTGDVYVSSHEGKMEMWFAFINQVWGNSFVVNLDPVTGKRVLRYVNTGTLHSLQEIRAQGKNFLLAGGFNNEADTGSLAVIDQAKSFAASPQTSGTRHQCLNCPEGVPDYYFVFPRSEIYDLEEIHEDAVTAVRVVDDQIEVIKGGPKETDRAQVHYTLRAQNGFLPVAVRFNSDYDMLHRKLEKEGKLRHSLEECPERLHPKAVRMWRPAGGWTEIKIGPSAANQ